MSEPTRSCRSSSSPLADLDLADVRELANLDLVLADLADALVQAGVPIVGATTSFDQTAPALAQLAAIKARDPAVRTLLGGANCA